METIQTYKAPTLYGNNEDVRRLEEFIFGDIQQAAYYPETAETKNGETVMWRHYQSGFNNYGSKLIVKEDGLIWIPEPYGNTRQLTHSHIKFIETILGHKVYQGEVIEKKTSWPDDKEEKPLEKKWIPKNGERVNCLNIHGQILGTGLFIGMLGSRFIVYAWNYDEQQFGIFDSVKPVES